METNSIREYIERNQARKNIHARFADGEMMYNHKGKWISREKFEKLYPKYEYKKNNFKGENPNKKSV